MMKTKPTPRPIGEVVAELEAAALDGHKVGLSWIKFYACWWNKGLVEVARHDPGGYARVAQRLASILATGTPNGLFAAGDDVDQAPPVPAVQVADDTATVARLQPGVLT
jgi:hypothetical protein